MTFISTAKLIGWTRNGGILMDFKQVFLYNGVPYLAFSDGHGGYLYPAEDWTEIPPPKGIYMPFYFDGSAWIGSTRKEWKELHKNEIEKPIE